MADVEFQMQNHYFKQRDEVTYPIRRAEKIEPNKIYRSRGGERIQVYAVVDKEIHGAIYHSGTWEIDTWNLDGTYLKGRGKDHVRDIVIKKPLTIKENTKYKSRDGRPIKVFAINGGSKDFPVIGAIKENNYWLPRVWNAEGITKVPYGPNNDIVTEWSES